MSLTSKSRLLFLAPLLFLGAGASQTHATQPQLKPAVSTNSPTHPHAHTNRLAREKSPYLLQHQHNPVDWFAWGEDAFAKARQEDKPIFLSIGYSTCHWCHVMERESFENDETARYLNEHFVSIKVDREERPDVDKIYMTFVQSMAGSGGWPLNVFIAPDLKPFYGGTYWPPERKYGKPSFVEVLQQIDNAWKTKRAQITNSSTQYHERLVDFASRQSAGALILTSNLVRNAGSELKEGYDPVNGGFGTAPKFPSPSHPAFLLSYGSKYRDDEATKMVLHTCDRMAAGGIYDQIGGGFSRYSVDAQWLVPHFEKMLYDNAQLLNLYLDAHLVSGQSRYADVARDILRYVLRDMTHPDGGFYSAEDADSEGKEGKFYCWTRAELSKLLAPEEFNVTVKYFGITEKGNFVDHSDPSPLPNQNVLSIADPATLAPTAGERAEVRGPSPLPGATSAPATPLKSANLSTLSPAEGERAGVRGPSLSQGAASDPAALLKSATEKMFRERCKRVRPHLDDKVLASWNGLMLGALARAAIVLNDDTYRAAAAKNVAFLQGKLWDAKTKTLYHRWRDGQRDSVQLLEAYAFLLSGVLELYQATLDPKHLDFAVALADGLLAKFYDKDNGGFWQSAADASDLILRMKEDYDGAEPSGNSVAILALLKLSAMTERKDFKEAAEKSLRFFSDRLQKSPQAVPYMLMALDFSLDEPRRAVLAGDPKAAATRELLRAAHAVYQPNKVILGTEGALESFAKTLKPKDG
ncbi:MAG TPA: thioredoxin domain-containing protein, partial [Verrucomicrobiae bacterium]